MSMTDPIADLLTRIRNGINASHEVVELPSSRLKGEIVRILKEEGYIAAYELRPPGGGPGEKFERLQVTLKYTDERRPVISGLRRVSRPGRRTYVDAGSIPRVLGGMGTAIVSTSRGVMTGHDARRQGVGGEVLAEVW
jgi:small subunit ribosomal protein S8